MRDTIFFSIYSRSTQQPDLLVVEPVVNGQLLSQLIYRYERQKNFEVAGGYGGLIPEFFKYGMLDRYFLGDHDSDSFWAGKDGIYVLGCQCGEVGCWPLQCRIRIEGDAVIWEHFQQPFRSMWDYSRFGPFVFDATQYRQALTALIAEFSTEEPNTR